jgi:hypothetical protein
MVSSGLGSPLDKRLEHVITPREAWFLSTAEKDEVIIIKMFYDIPAKVDGKIPHYGMLSYVP